MHDHIEHFRQMITDFLQLYVIFFVLKALLIELPLFFFIFGIWAEIWTICSFDQSLCMAKIMYNIATLSMRKDISVSKITNKKNTKRSKYFSQFNQIYITHFTLKRLGPFLVIFYSIFKIQFLFLQCVKEVSEMLKNIAVDALVKKLC